MNSDVVNTFIELAEINAASGNERGIADRLKAELAALGCTAIVEDDTGKIIGGNAGSVYAVFPGELPGWILFCGHMDRVENGLGIKPRIQDGVITSDGSTILAADDLAGISAILDGLRRIKKSAQPHCSVEIVFTVSEEVHLEGSRHFDFSRIKSEFGFVFDSSGHVGRIVASAPSAAQLTIETYGKKAHAGAEPEKGKNALLGMAKILCDIQDGRLDYETTANYAVCNVGDAATNIVCDYAKVLGEVRSRNNEKLEDYISYFKAHCQGAAEGFDMQVKAEALLLYKSFVVPEKAPVVRLAKNSMQKLGITPLVEAGGGGMDANRFAEHGIPCIGIATGYFENHTTAERLVVQDLIKAGELAEQIIREASEHGNLYWADS